MVALIVVVLIALPFFSLRLGSSDQGNDPAGTTTRQAYDLLATGFGPGLQRSPAAGGPERRARPTSQTLDKLAAEVQNAARRGQRRPARSSFPTKDGKTGQR